MFVTNRLGGSFTFDGDPSPHIGVEGRVVADAEHLDVQLHHHVVDQTHHSLCVFFVQRSVDLVSSCPSVLLRRICTGERGGTSLGPIPARSLQAISALRTVPPVLLFRECAMLTRFPRVIGVVSDANRDFFVNVLSMNGNGVDYRGDQLDVFLWNLDRIQYRTDNQSFTERFEMFGDRLESRFVQFFHSDIRVVDESTERIHSLLNHLRSL